MAKQDIIRLYLSTEDKKILGVCGGLAEYFDTDPTLIRIGYILITVVTGVIPGLIAYFIIAFITPKQPA